MAERERLTNKERRAQAREERKRKEAEEAAKRKRGQLRNGLITAVVVAVIAAVLLQAFLGGPDTLADQVTVAADEAEAARAAAGCEVIVEREPLEDRSHFERGQLPPADQVYTGVRPTHSGPHSASVVGISTYSRQMEEVVSTHNLEHGSVIVWWDESIDAGPIESWAETLNASGFEGPAGSGVGIITSPWTDPGFDDDSTTVAFRAWGTAMDCEEWDETVANEFVARNFTTRGIGPERFFYEYPEHVLDLDGVELEDTAPEEAPTDEHTPEEELEGDDALDDEADTDADGEDAEDAEE